MTTDRLFIGGKWQPSASGRTLPVVNPATEAVIAEVPEGTAEDVDRAVDAAAKVADDWAASSVDERAALFRKAAALTEGRSEEITQTIVSEVGQPYSVAVTSQTANSVDDLAIIADVLGDVRWEEQMGRTVVRREPAGLVGAITPWNSPLHQVCVKVGAAVAAGCTVVLKPSEVAPLSAYILMEVLQEAGLPDGVVNLVSGTGAVVGEALAAHPLVEMVSLTGSVPAGRRVMELASGTVKRVALELGGKSPNIVFDDVDLEKAVSDGVADCFRNSGQVCGGLSRLLVPRACLAQVEEIAAGAAGSYVVGDPFALTTTLGPVTTQRQRDRVVDYIRLGAREGATTLVGGPDRPDDLPKGWFVRPTVFSSATNGMRIAREEVFGPVLVIVPFDSEDEAVALANDSEYGLAAGIWSADPARALRVAKRLRVGRVRVNGAPLNRRAPHGGFRQSGIGREWGRFGIEDFLEYKSVLL